MSAYTESENDVGIHTLDKDVEVRSNDLHTENPLALLDIPDSSKDATGSVQQTDFDEKLPDFQPELIESNNVIEEAEGSVKTKKVRQRLWTVMLSVVVACIPFLLAGCTLGFPSGALLDLTDLEERTDFKLTRQQADLFGVG